MLHDGDIYVSFFNEKKPRIIRGIEADGFDVAQNEDVIATIHKQKGIVRLWQIKTSPAIQDSRRYVSFTIEYPFPSLYSNILSVSKTHNLICLINDRKLTLWNAETGELASTEAVRKIVEKYRFEYQAGSCLFSPDGNYLATGFVMPSLEPFERLDIIWDIRDGSIRYTSEGKTYFDQLFPLNGQLAARLMGLNIEIVDFYQDKTIAELQTPTEYSKNDSFITDVHLLSNYAVVGVIKEKNDLVYKDVICWSIKTGDIIWQYKQKNKHLWMFVDECCGKKKYSVDYSSGILPYRIQKIAVNPNQKHLVIFFNSGMFALVDATTGVIIKFWEAHKECRRNYGYYHKAHCSFDSTGHYLLSVRSCSQELKVWDVSSRNLIATFKTDTPLLEAEFLPNNRIVGVNERGLYWLRLE